MILLKSHVRPDKMKATSATTGANNHAVTIKSGDRMSTDKQSPKAADSTGNAEKSPAASQTKPLPTISRQMAIAKRSVCV